MLVHLGEKSLYIRDVILQETLKKTNSESGNPVELTRSEFESEVIKFWNLEPQRKKIMKVEKISNGFQKMQICCYLKYIFLRRLYASDDIVINTKNQSNFQDNE